MKTFTLITILTLQLCCFFPLTAVTAQRTVVKEAEVRRLVTDYLLQKDGNLGLTISVKKIGYSGDLTLPPGKVAFEVVAPDRWEGWGSANLALIVRVDDRVERNISLRVEVEALADMVIAARPLERGEVVKEGDVVIGKRDLSKVQGRVYRTLDEVLGKMVRTGIRGNSPLRNDTLERVPLIKSGQLVTIVAENNTMRITASGKARNSGAAGDEIMVQNLTSQKEISARVLDAATVRVEF